LTSGVVYGNQSHKLGHPRAIPSHWRPIYRLDDLRERLGKRFLSDRRAIDLDPFGAGQKMRPGERADLHRHSSSVMMGLQKRRDEAASASFSLGACYMDHVETAQVFLLGRSELGVSLRCRRFIELTVYPSRSRLSLTYGFESRRLGRRGS
jgi:hypothetical protein